MLSQQAFGMLEWNKSMCIRTIIIFITANATQNAINILIFICI